MSVNAAIFLADIYMSRLENDTKSYKMFRRSKILFYHILSIFFSKPCPYQYNSYYREKTFQTLNNIEIYHSY